MGIKQILKKSALYRLYRKTDVIWRGSGAGSLWKFLTHPERIKFKLNLEKIRKIDKRYGTNFLGGGYGRLEQKELGIPTERANDYSGSPTEVIKTLSKYDITKDDAIIDIGCGMGLAMWYMSQFSFGEIGGIELSEMLIKNAKSNLSIMKNKTGKKCNFKFFSGDAGKWDGYKDYNYFYIYNSLPKQVMEEFADRIELSLKEKERDIIIMYLMPEFPEVLMKRK